MHYVYEFLVGNDETAAKQYRAQWLYRAQYTRYRLFPNIHREYDESREGRHRVDVEM